MSRFQKFTVLGFVSLVMTLSILADKALATVYYCQPPQVSCSATGCYSNYGGSQPCPMDATKSYTEYIQNATSVSNCATPTGTVTCQISQQALWCSGSGYNSTGSGACNVYRCDDFAYGPGC